MTQQGGEPASALLRLSPGDHWDYATVTTADGRQTRTTRAWVDGVENVTLAGGATWEAVRIVTNTTGQTVGKIVVYANTTTIAWARASDGALLRTTTDTQSAFGAGGYHLRSNTSYVEPCPAYVSPLRVGLSWNASCAASVTTETLPPLPVTRSPPTNVTVRATYEVVRAERATVPAGAFDALVVNVTSGNQTETRWYAAAACGSVKVQAPQQAGGPDALQAFQCANPPAAPASASAPPPSPAARAPVPGALLAGAALAGAAVWRRRRVP